MIAHLAGMSGNALVGMDWAQSVTQPPTYNMNEPKPPGLGILDLILWKHDDGLWIPWLRNFRRDDYTKNWHPIDSGQP